MVAAQLGVLANATNKVRLIKLTFVLGVLISILLWPAIVGAQYFCAVQLVAVINCSAVVNFQHPSFLLQRILILYVL